MFNPAQQGFGRYASNSGFKALGAAPGLNYEAGAELGSAALAAKAKIKAAKYQADATRYQGRQARNASIFGGAMNMIGSLGGAAIGSGMFSKKPPTQGIGPVADGATYGGYLDSMQGIGGMGPVASGSTYGAFLNSPRGYGGF